MDKLRIQRYVDRVRDLSVISAVFAELDADLDLFGFSRCGESHVNIDGFTNARVGDDPFI